MQAVQGQKAVLTKKLTRGKRTIHPSWIVVLAGVSAALHVGKLPPALPVLQQELGVTLVQAGFLLSMVQLAGMALGLVVGLGADTLGLRRTMLTGLGLLALASGLGGFADGFGMLLALRALEGLGFLLVVMPAPAMIRRTVDVAQLNPRMGWWGTYMPLGSATAFLLGPLVLMNFPWPVWWWALGVVSALAWLAVWWWVPAQGPADVSAKAAVARTAPRAATGSGWAQRLGLTLRSSGPWLLSLGFMVYSSQWIAVIGFLPTVYAQAGLASGLTGVLTASVALANVSGNVLSGRLLQRGWRAEHLLYIGFACMALGAVGAFAQWGDVGLPLPLRFASVVFFSAVGGLIPGTLFASAVRLAPSEDTVSTTVGSMQQLSALGQFAGPPLVAWVAAGAGGWQWTWVVTVALCVAGSLLARRIGKV